MKKLCKTLIVLDIFPVFFYYINKNYDNYSKVNILRRFMQNE